MCPRKIGFCACQPRMKSVSVIVVFGGLFFSGYFTSLFLWAGLFETVFVFTSLLH